MNIEQRTFRKVMKSRRRHQRWAAGEMRSKLRALFFPVMKTAVFIKAEEANAKKAHLAQLCSRILAE